MTRRLRGDQDGAVTVLTALVLVAMLAAGAVAVDLGRLTAASRDQQGVTDRAALDGLLALDGDVRAAVEASLARNADGMSAGRTVVEVDAVDCEHGVAAPPWTHASGVRVVTSLEVGSLLRPGSAGTTVRREATACARPAASVRIGTTTATLEDGALNALLGAMLLRDAPLDLALVGHAGVTDAIVDLGQLSGALGVATVDEVLTADVGVLDLLDATLAVLHARDDASVGAFAAELAALRTPLLEATSELPTVQLGDLLTLDAGERAGARLGVDAIDLLIGSLQLAHAELYAADRDHAVTLDLSLLPGLGGLAPVRMTVVEPPQLAVGPPGQRTDGSWRTEARTAQVALEIELPVGHLVDVVGDAHDTDASARADAYRDRIAALDTDLAGCLALPPVMADLRAEVRGLEGHADALGLRHLVASLLGGLDDLVSGALETVTCLTSVTRPVAFEAAARRVDEFEALVGAVNRAATDGATTARPSLRVTVGGGRARLVTASCAPPQRIGIQAASATAAVELPPTRLLDLGVLGEITVALDTTVAGTGWRQVDVVGAASPPHWPSPTHRIGTTGLGLGAALTGLDASGSSLVMLPVGEVLDLVTAALSPVLTSLDGALSPLLGALGVELGVAEVQVVDADCSGRQLADRGGLVAP